ncbi:MAG TPA: acetyltransferase [candidate division Zixibacteria bacterium]|nr:acetyltransferase [candidate division Zixibacteria bacterium]
MKDLIIIGAGGHGKVVADTARANEIWQDISFLDDKFPNKNDVSGFGIVGKLTEIDNIDNQTTDIVVALGNNKKRFSLIQMYKEKGYNLPDIIHPTAVISASVKMNGATVIFPGAIVNADTSIGIGCIINTAVTIDHDCTIKDGVHLSPGSHLGGNVTVGKNTWIGIGTAVINNTNIGDDVIVGAGSVVISDVKDNVVAYGVPAKIK